MDPEDPRVRFELTQHVVRQVHDLAVDDVQAAVRACEALELGRQFGAGDERHDDARRPRVTETAAAAQFFVELVATNACVRAASLKASAFNPVLRLTVLVRAPAGSRGVRDETEGD